MTFSIVTICFNSEKYIQEALESVYKQSCLDYEYIVIDGKSTDDTCTILSKYEKKFNGKMRFLSEKDSGIYNAMNKGLSLAQGDYVLFLNSDDYFGSEMLSTLLREIQRERSDCFYTDTYIVDKNKKGFWNANIHEIYTGMSINHIGLAVKRSVLLENSGFNENYRIAADWDLALRLYLKGYTFIYYHNTNTYFRYGGASASIDKHIHELEQIYTTNIFPSLHISYKEMKFLYKFNTMNANSFHECEKILQKISKKSEHTEAISLFLYSYAMAAQKYHISRYEAQKQSISWIITTPLRYLERFAKRIFS